MLLHPVLCLSAHPRWQELLLPFALSAFLFLFLQPPAGLEYITNDTNLFAFNYYIWSSLGPLVCFGACWIFEVWACTVKNIWRYSSIAELFSLQDTISLTNSPFFCLFLLLVYLLDFVACQRFPIVWAV
jgi:hypothetical protein